MTITLQKFDAQGAGQVAEEVTTLYRMVYGAEEPAASDPFHSRERFLDRFDGYRRGRDFTLIVARDAATMVGFAYGYALPPQARWWEGNEPRISADIAERTRTGSVFALNDIAVHPAYRRRGIAEALHQELLDAQSGRSVTLLVELENEPAATAYGKWGYRPIGQQQPFPDSPVYRTMILDRPVPPTETDSARRSLPRAAGLPTDGQTAARTR